MAQVASVGGRDRTWSKTPGKLWKVGETAEGRARENPAFPPFLSLAAASIRRCCTCVPGVFDQMLLEGSSREEAARHAGMDRQTLRDWVHRYNAEGLPGLRDRPRSGRRPRLSPEQEAELATAVERGPDPDRDGVVRWRRGDLRALIEARFAVRLHERSVGKVLRRLGFSRVSGPPPHPKADEAAQGGVKKASPSRWRGRRPRHPKADEAAQEAFKKASPSWWRERCPSTPAASRSRSGFRMKPASASRAP